MINLCYHETMTEVILMSFGQMLWFCMTDGVSISERNLIFNHLFNKCITGDKTVRGAAYRMKHIGSRERTVLLPRYGSHAAERDGTS